jgi:hypothetical protein
MRSAVRACSMLLMTCALLADSASARDYLSCLTNKVVIVDAASGSTSSKTEENLGFWIDETAKSLTLADGTPSSSVASMTAGSVPLAVMCPTNLTVRTAI